LISKAAELMIEEGWRPDELGWMTSRMATETAKDITSRNASFGSAGASIFPDENLILGPLL
jgi:hypothetical protein